MSGRDEPTKIQEQLAKEKAMSANTEKCADKAKAVCDFNEFARLRYVQGMLLDDKDFQAEQKYHVGKRKFLNRMLHGSGVVCGLGVTGEQDGRSIEVGSGFALDCSGNEIWVSHSVKIDLASLIPPRAKPKEAECEEKVEENPGEYYIGIRYDEKGTNPVSIYLPSGGCDERTCENSRYKEGYCIEVVDCCLRPKASAADHSLRGLINGSLNPKADDTQGHRQATCGHCENLEGEALERCLELEQRCGQSVPCPECCSCDSACSVVLGKITVDENLRLKTICLNECRKYVVTGHLIRHLVRGMTDSNDDQDVEEFVNNPIKALCEFLQSVAVRKETVQLPDWVQTRTSDSSSEIDTLRTRIQRLEAQFATLKGGPAPSADTGATPANVANAEPAAEAGAPAIEAAGTAKPKGKTK
jgi:hypothetical protein